MSSHRKPAPGAAALTMQPVDCPLCGSSDKATAVDDLFDFRRPDNPQRFAFSRCRACDLVYLDPRPTNLDEVYQDDYGKHHAKGKAPPGLRSYSRRLMHRAFQDYPPAAPLGGLIKKIWARRWARYQVEHGHMCVPWAGEGKGRLLDVGSGAGDKAVKYAHIGWQVQGVETDAEAAARGTEYHGFEIKAGYLQDQHYPDSAFDAVTLLFVLEHVPDPLSILKEIHRILAPGGALMVDVPNFDSGLRPLFGSCWTQYTIPEHWLLPTDRTLRTMLERAGFRVEYARHRYSLALYRKAYERAVERGTVPEGVPDPRVKANDAAVHAWLEKTCAPPHGELLLALALKE